MVAIQLLLQQYNLFSYNKLFCYNYKLSAKIRMFIAKLFSATSLLTLKYACLL